MKRLFFLWAALAALTLQVFGQAQGVYMRGTNGYTWNSNANVLAFSPTNGIIVGRLERATNAALSASRGSFLGGDFRQSHDASLTSDFGSFVGADLFGADSTFLNGAYGTHLGVSAENSTRFRAVAESGSTVGVFADSSTDVDVKSDRGGVVSGFLDNSSAVMLRAVGGQVSVHSQTKSNQRIIGDQSAVFGTPPNNYTNSFTNSMVVIGPDGRVTGFGTNGFFGNGAGLTNIGPLTNLTLYGTALQYPLLVAGGNGIRVNDNSGNQKALIDAAGFTGNGGGLTNVPNAGLSTNVTLANGWAGANDGLTSDGIFVGRGNGAGWQGRLYTNSETLLTSGFLAGRGGYSGGNFVSGTNWAINSLGGSFSGGDFAASTNSSIFSRGGSVSGASMDSSSNCFVTSRNGGMAGGNFLGTIGGQAIATNGGIAVGQFDYSINSKLVSPTAGLTHGFLEYASNSVLYAKNGGYSGGFNGFSTNSSVHTDTGLSVVDGSQNKGSVITNFNASFAGGELTSSSNCLISVANASVAMGSLVSAVETKMTSGNGSFVGLSGGSSSNVIATSGKGLLYVYAPNRTNVSITANRSIILATPPNNLTNTFESTIAILDTNGVATGFSTNGLFGVTTTLSNFSPNATLMWSSASPAGSVSNLTLYNVDAGRISGVMDTGNTSMVVRASSCYFTSYVAQAGANTYVAITPWKSGGTGPLIDVYSNGVQKAYIAATGRFANAANVDAGDTVSAANNGTYTKGFQITGRIFLTSPQANWLSVRNDDGSSGFGGLLLGNVGNQGSTLYISTNWPALYVSAATNNPVLSFVSGTNTTVPVSIAASNSVLAGYVNPTNGILFQGGGNLTNVYTGTATLDFPSTAAGTMSELTITVTGAADGDVVALGVPNGSMPANGSYQAYVSSANTVTVRYVNNDLITARDPASGTFRARVEKWK